jgi:2-oxoglutarate dehydrogenase E1 component
MGFDKYTFASGSNAAYIESLYEDYRSNPASLDESWQKFFEGYEFGLNSSGSQNVRRDDAKVEAYINTYRRLGYLAADLNPLEDRRDLPDNLQPAFHGLEDVSPNKAFLTANFGDKEMTLAEISKKLQDTYCGSIGPDFRDSNDVNAVVWLQNIMESCSNKPSFNVDTKKRIAKKLAEAEVFETFLQTRYLGQKRFSGEGLDTLIPLLDTLIDEASQIGIQEINLGMAHRGRLNVLTNILQKPYEHIIQEFEGFHAHAEDIEGDVKYHLGYASEVTTASGGRIRMYLAQNPSHLEIINAPLEGFTRARQEQNKKEEILPLLIHGDAAFIGQGIVAEIFNLSQLKSYETGGTIHIISNNQIGFTTNPEDGRSCTFSSDLSKMVRSPVLHVNADDAEAVVWVTKIAVAYRNTFKKDIVIDLIGYRRHGHNETDEPGFTQPLMYKRIEQQVTAFQKYAKKLVEEKVLNEEEGKALVVDVRNRLNEAQKRVKTKGFTLLKSEVPAAFKSIFDYRKAERSEIMQSVKTSIDESKLKEITKALTTWEDGFTPHPKILRLLEHRSKMLDNDGAVDWGFGELLAFASLGSEGYPVRLSGQDCKRGTFSSRHAVLFDYESGRPLETLRKKDWAPITVINSPLSELGCLGFEFGYSVASPNTLVLWEAQFGDFVNGAQILLDQFLVASEAKWQQTSGLVLLLPHGHEGMGPEHTSARPERFLQSCGNLNIQVCNLTSPAQLFHALRRQVLRSFRKPLVIMTPKSLLRHPKVVSQTKEFTRGAFEELLDDTQVKGTEKVQRLLMCTGKIYYELDAFRETHPDVAKVPILRLEQLYPFPYEGITKLLQKNYPQVREIIWVQEEPKNMGAWNFVRSRMQEVKHEIQTVTYVGRKNSGSTAEGSLKAHEQEQKRIIEEAFRLAKIQVKKLAAK